MPRVVLPWPNSAWPPMNDSKTNRENGRTERSGTISLPGNAWPRSLGNTYIKVQNSMSRAGCKPQAGKIARPEKRSTAQKSWPATLYCWVMAMDEAATMQRNLVKGLARASTRTTRRIRNRKSRTKISRFECVSKDNNPRHLEGVKVGSGGL